MTSVEPLEPLYLGHLVGFLSLKLKELYQSKKGGRTGLWLPTQLEVDPEMGFLETSPIQGHATAKWQGQYPNQIWLQEQAVPSPSSMHGFPEGSEPTPLEQEHQSTPVLVLLLVSSSHDSERHCPFHLKGSSHMRLASQLIKTFWRILSTLRHRTWLAGNKRAGSHQRPSQPAPKCSVQNPEERRNS